MTVLTPTLRKARPASGRSTRARLRTASRRIEALGTGALETAAQPASPIELETIVNHWQRAFDAAERALRAADRDSMPAAELQRRRFELMHERLQTAMLLERLADVAGIRPASWLSPR